MKSAIVIGAGFGGLALAIRLQSAGIQTTIVEARDKRLQVVSVGGLLQPGEERLCRISHEGLISL